MKATETRIPTFALDSTLPKLPVPSLRDTFDRLHASVQVTARDAEETAAFDELVKDAIPKLEAAQGVLLARAASQANYIGDWWEEFAYLMNRFPNVINTNVFCVRDSDFDALGSPNPLSRDPAVRAALVAFESLSFRNLILREELPPERSGNVPLCMKQYKSYWTTRIPGSECDSIHTADPRQARCIGIMHRGAIFFINVDLHPDAPVGADDLNVAELTEVIRFGLSRVRPPPLEECVGSLTSADRTTWAAAFSELQSLSENNKKILEQLMGAITVIAIDDEPVTSLKEGIHRASHQLPHNRWYDRSSLRIVSSNGICLEHGDHTAMDAIVMASTPVDYMTKLSRDFVRDGGLTKTRVREGFDVTRHVTNVSWDLSPSLRRAIKEALDAHSANTDGIEIDCYAYLGFGRDALRQEKIPPDAFVQQVIQLAFKRDRGCMVPVYETATTRQFQEGRTDTIRSFTAEQKAFVEAFDDPDVSVQKKRQLLRGAILKHVALTVDAVSGRGVDRHLLALRIAQQMVLQKPLPKIFDLAAVQRAGAFKLLTSQMVGQFFVGGFAHVLDDGYGCCYYLRRNAICVVVSGCSKGGLTSVDRFQKHLTDSFRDVAAILKASEKEDPPQSVKVPSKL